MPRAYLIAESPEKYADPIHSGPTYLIGEPADWNREFEHWYVDENYVCIDDDGHRYVFRWDTKLGLVAEIAETSAKLKSLFYDWLKVWIDSLSPQSLAKLHVAEERRDEARLESILNNGEMLKKLSKRRL